MAGLSRAAGHFAAAGSGQALRLHTEQVIFPLEVFAAALLFRMPADIYSFS
jgi:hypothetical protein